MAKTAPVRAPFGTFYETVAASQTTQSLGPTGAVGDFIRGLIVVPTNTTCGQITLTDGTTGIVVFQGGSTSVSDLKPFFIELNLHSVVGAWKVTTGTAISCIGMGVFT